MQSLTDCVMTRVISPVMNHLLTGTTARTLTLTTLVMGSLLLPAKAQAPETQFAPLVLNAQMEAGVEGKTGGSFSLTAVSQYDDNNPHNLCSGYSHDANVPDHILQIPQGINQPMSLWINSNGQDTTLVIQHRDRLSCADDMSPSNTDAGITQTQWPAGVYKIWVGSSKPGQSYPYTLQMKTGPLP